MESPHCPDQGPGGMSPERTREVLTAQSTSSPNMGTQDSPEDSILYSDPGQMTGGSHSVSQGCLDELTYEYIQSTHAFVYQVSRQAQGMASPSQGREWQRSKVLKELMKKADSSPEMHLA